YVDADHRGAGELATDVVCPLPGATADVQHPARRGDGSEVVPAEREAERVVLDVEAIDLGRVAGEQVRPMVARRHLHGHRGLVLPRNIERLFVRSPSAPPCNSVTERTRDRRRPADRTIIAGSGPPRGGAGAAAPAPGPVAPPQAACSAGRSPKKPVML